MATWNGRSLCGDPIRFGSCRDPRSFSAYGGTRFVTFETVGITTASGIEETGALLCLTVEMPTELATLAETVVGRHVAPRFGRHLIVSFNDYVVR